MHIINPGLRPSVDLVASYLQRLYAGYRPMNLKIPDRYLHLTIVIAIVVGYRLCGPSQSDSEAMP